MALDQLTHRLSGVVAICLAVVLVPLSRVEHIAVLTALSLGVGLASVLPRYDRLAVRAAGPAVLVVAAASLTTGLGWKVVALVALVVLGLASFTPAGMSRTVPALGLPMMGVVIESGQPVSVPVLGGWVVAVVVMLMVGGWVRWPDAGAPLGQPGGTTPGLTAPPAFDQGRAGWRGVTGAGVVVLALVPISLVAAGLVERAVPRLLMPTSRAGNIHGAALGVHPGLTGELDVGAPVSLDDGVVLRVQADRPLYWRGVTYDQWDGRRWTSSTERERLGWDGPGVSLERDDEVALSVAVDLPPPITVTQHYRLERAGLDVLLAGWRASSLWTTAQEASYGDDASLLVSPLGAGATWTVESQIVPATEDDLRRADPRLLGSDHPLMVRFGTEKVVDPEVVELARAITADAPTTYDQILAIEEWMAANITYTRQIDTLAPGSDAVHHLLFRSRKGFCEQIGSALVVMLRSLGIPARLVVGYVPSGYDAARHQWLSRGTDAHAWAEVYFPGVGWQGFDPTAEVPQAVAPVTGTSTGALAATVGFGLVLGAVAVGVIRLRGMGRPWRRRSSGSVDELGQLLARFEHCGLQLGCSWGPSSTLRERGADLCRAGVDPTVVERSVRALEQVLFAAQAPQAPSPQVRSASPSTPGPVGVDGGVAAGQLAWVEAELTQLEWCTDLILVRSGREDDTRFALPGPLRNWRPARATPPRRGRHR